MSPIFSSEGKVNKYGEFVAIKARDTSSITFVLDSLSGDFPKVQEVSMIDFGDDGEGDIVAVFYRTGDKEVFFRNKPDYRRYVAQVAPANVCKIDWTVWLIAPKKIVYRKRLNRWECKSAFWEQKIMWGQIDEGLDEAKREDWDALAERILENVKKITKK